jgi:hypothetical protein
MRPGAPAKLCAVNRPVPVIAVARFGGLSVALARTFRILEPGVKNPGPESWQRSFDLFNLLV